MSLQLRKGCDNLSKQSNQRYRKEMEKGQTSKTIQSRATNSNQNQASKNESGPNNFGTSKANDK